MDIKPHMLTATNTGTFDATMFRYLILMSYFFFLASDFPCVTGGVSHEEKKNLMNAIFNEEHT